MGSLLGYLETLMDGFLSEAVKYRQNGFACPSTLGYLGLQMFHIFNTALIYIFTNTCMA
jgi:hypothetical protein